MTTATVILITLAAFVLLAICLRIMRKYEETDHDVEEEREFWKSRYERYKK